MIQLDRIQKMALSGILLALVIIFTRFLAIQNIPIIPFVRLSLGPALIIFSSILLGPVYGGLIGGLSDLLGIVLVPNALGFSINPFFTLVYTLLGILPWCILKLISKIKNGKVLFYVTSSTLTVVYVFMITILFMFDSITVFKTYNFELWQKITIAVVSFILVSASLLILYFINKKHEDKYDKKSIGPYHLSFVMMISEIVVLFFINSLVKMAFFEVDFLFVLFAQAVVSLIEIPLNLFINLLLLKLVAKIYTRKVSISDVKE